MQYSSFEIALIKLQLKHYTPVLNKVGNISRHKILIRLFTPSSSTTRYKKYSLLPSFIKKKKERNLF